MGTTRGMTYQLLLADLRAREAIRAAARAKEYRDQVTRQYITHASTKRAQNDPQYREQLTKAYNEQLGLIEAGFKPLHIKRYM